MCKKSGIIFWSVLFAFFVNMVSAQERGEKNLLTVIRDIYPSWSPDGKKLAFHSNRTSFSKWSDEKYQIFVMDVESREVKQLTYGPYSKRLPNWSRDGRHVLYSLETNGLRDIYLMDSDGLNQRNLTQSDTNEYSSSWFPQGNMIIFDSDRDGDQADQFPNRDLYSMDIDTGETKRLTDYFEWDTYGSVSPDGSKIVWRRVLLNFDNSSNAEIFTSDLDGSNEIRLTNNLAFDSYPVWSPDGTKIMFSSNRDGDHYEDFNIFLINSDGTGLQQITETIHEVEQIRAKFSPDGSKIAYNRQYLDGRIEIRILNMTDE